MKKITTINKQLLTSCLVINCLLLFFESVTAQPVINTFVPQIEINFKEHVVQWVDAGKDGANQIWDFSNLDSLYLQVGDKYIDTTSQEYLHFHNFFTEANYISRLSGFSTGFYHIYKFTTDSANLIGYTYCTVSSGAYDKYKDSRKVFQFPFHYQDSFSDYYKSYYENCNPGGPTYYFYHHGITTCIYDAYGKIILPFGEVNNVVRIKNIDSLTDINTSPYYDSSIYVFEKYSWYIPGLIEPIMMIQKKFENGIASDSSAIYFDPNTLGINNTYPVSRKLFISPNPASTSLTITTIPLSSLTVTNLLGQQIYFLRKTQLIPETIHQTGRNRTNKIERMNLTLRTHLKRLNRKTICFSKSEEMLNSSLSIYFWS